MRRSVRILLLTAVCLALPAAAPAATPFTAGSGERPSVAVGSDGTGHIAWITTEANTKVGYCRVSPGATACNRTELLKFGASTDANPAGRAQVFAPAPGKVVIVAGCWNCPSGGNVTYRWISTDNGASFASPPTVIGSELEAGTAGFGAWLETGQIFLAASGSRVKAESGATTGQGAQYVTTPLFTYGPQVVQVPGAEELVAATNNLDEVRYGVYDTVPFGTTALNDSDNWLKDQTLPSPEPGNSETSLNAGPNGVYLTYLTMLAGDERVGLRRYDAGTNDFGAPTYVEGGDPIDDSALNEPDSFQDSSGRIHVVWRTLYDGGRLRYTVSNTSAGGFSAAATLAQFESVAQPEVAAGADGRGFATWTPGTSGAVRVVPLDPHPDSSSPPSEDVPGAPTVEDFEIADTTLRPGQRTRFRFRASEAGMAVLTFEKRYNGLKGKRKGKRACLPRTRKRLRALRRKARSPRAYRRLLKKRRCRAFRKVGEIRQRVAPGVNTIEFDGRVAGQKLKAGQYRARLVITDTAGLVSRTEALRFSVVGPKKKKRPKRQRTRS